MSWTNIPLTCDEISKAISYVSIPERIPSDDIRPYIVAAIRKNPPLDDEARFIWDLKDELEAYSSAAAGTRGWTLQEFLAASRIKCFDSDWRILGNNDGRRASFDASRNKDNSFSPIYRNLQAVAGRRGNLRLNSYR